MVHGNNIAEQCPYGFKQEFKKNSVKILFI